MGFLDKSRLFGALRRRWDGGHTIWAVIGMESFPAGVVVHHDRLCAAGAVRRIARSLKPMSTTNATGNLNRAASIKQMLASLLCATVLLPATPVPAEVGGPSAAGDPIPPLRRIFAAGGGIMGSNAPWPLMRYILSLTGKPEPVVVCLPTARGDHLENIVAWYEMMNQLPCRPRHLRLFGPTKDLRDFEQQLLAADVIFVQGGNTLNMLATWKAQGVDAILRKAWERGILLAGESAGMVCWFEQTVTDSRPGGLTALDGLGWLKGGACPHYHTDSQRKPAFQKLLTDGGKDGVACDDGAGLLFEGEKLVKVVTVSEKATAYTLRHHGAQVVEEPMKAELLVNTAK